MYTTDIIRYYPISQMSTCILQCLLSVTTLLHYSTHLVLNGVISLLYFLPETLDIRPEGGDNSVSLLQLRDVVSDLILQPIDLLL